MFAASPPRAPWRRRHRRARPEVPTHRSSGARLPATAVSAAVFPAVWFRPYGSRPGRHRQRCPRQPRHRTAAPRRQRHDPATTARATPVKTCTTWNGRLRSASTNDRSWPSGNRRHLRVRPVGERVGVDRGEHRRHPRPRHRRAPGPESTTAPAGAPRRAGRGQARGRPGGRTPPGRVDQELVGPHPQQLERQLRHRRLGLDDDLDAGPAALHVHQAVEQLLSLPVEQCGGDGVAEATDLRRKHRQRQRTTAARRPRRPAERSPMRRRPAPRARRHRRKCANGACLPADRP